jgi:hypothetical protein
VRPEEHVIGAIDDDKLGTGDSTVEHLRVVDWHALIGRSGDDERRTGDLAQAACTTRWIAVGERAE